MEEGTTVLFLFIDAENEAWVTLPRSYSWQVISDAIKICLTQQSELLTIMLTYYM